MTAYVPCNTGSLKTGGSNTTQIPISCDFAVESTRLRHANQKNASISWVRCDNESRLAQKIISIEFYDGCVKPRDHIDLRSIDHSKQFPDNNSNVDRPMHEFDKHLIFSNCDCGFVFHCRLRILLQKMPTEEPLNIIMFINARRRARSLEQVSRGRQKFFRSP